MRVWIPVPHFREDKFRGNDSLLPGAECWGRCKMDPKYPGAEYPISKFQLITASRSYYVPSYQLQEPTELQPSYFSVGYWIFKKHKDLSFDTVLEWPLYEEPNPLANRHFNVILKPSDGDTGS